MFHELRQTYWTRKGSNDTWDGVKQRYWHVEKLPRTQFWANTELNATKILAVLFSLFDPLEFLDPFVIRGRKIQKLIWQTRGQHLDSNISNDLNDDFHNWVSELNAGEPFNEPRLYRTSDGAMRNELHVFGDASKDAFYALAYIVRKNSLFVYHLLLVKLEMEL